MAEVSGVNPGLTVSTMADRHYDPPLDTLLLLRDYSATALSATANGTAVEFYATKYVAYEFIIRHAAITGVDGSNYWTVSFQIDNEATFTSPVTIASAQLGATATVVRVPMTGAEAQRLATAGGLTTQPTLIRAVFTETGTTAGNLTVGTWVDPVTNAAH